MFYVPQMSEYGGMERHVCLLAMLLAQKGHQLVMLTTSNSLNQNTRDELKSSGVELRELQVARGHASKTRKVVWLLLNVLLLRHRSWDVIYSSGQSALARVAWLASDQSSRIVHHHHTAADSDEQQTWHPLFRGLLASAPELVACSRTTKWNLKTVLRRDDIKYLPYLTPETDPYAVVRLTQVSPLGVVDFGFLGRLVSSKGIDTICRLSSQSELCNVRWHVHGRGEEYPPKYFDRFPNITFYGPYHGQGEIAAILARLDAVVLFSTHNEGMPLSLIEAMSAGLPWIATDRGGTAELAIIHQNCEVVPAYASFDDIVRCTLSLVSRIRAGMTSRAAQRRVYDENFAHAVCGRQWLEFLCQELPG